MDKYNTWDFGSVWHKCWLKMVYVGQWPIFHGPVILPYILKTIWWTKCHNLDIGSIWCKDLPHKMYMGQWPTLHEPVILSYWILFDGWILYWRYWYSMTQTLTRNSIIYRSVTYIPWSSDFALYVKDYLMVKCHNWDIGSMWCKDLPHKIYIG